MDSLCGLHGTDARVHVIVQVGAYDDVNLCVQYIASAGVQIIGALVLLVSMCLVAAVRRTTPSQSFIPAVNASVPAPPRGKVGTSRRVGDARGGYGGTAERDEAGVGAGAGAGAGATTSLLRGVATTGPTLGAGGRVRSAPSAAKKSGSVRGGGGGGGGSHSGSRARAAVAAQPWFQRVWLRATWGAVCGCVVISAVLCSILAHKAQDFTAAGSLVSSPAGLLALVGTIVLWASFLLAAVSTPTLLGTGRAVCIAASIGAVLAVRLRTCVLAGLIGKWGAHYGFWASAATYAGFGVVVGLLAAVFGVARAVLWAQRCVLR